MARPHSMALLDSVYSDLWSIYSSPDLNLESDSEVRSWPVLFAAAASAGLNRNSLVLDAGCGRGDHAFELCSRFGCRVAGVDLVYDRVRVAAGSDARTDRAGFVCASIDRLPIGNGAIDFVWCVNVLVHTRNLEMAVNELSRVLRPGGRMLLFVTVETTLMSPDEAVRIYVPLGIEPASVRRENLEHAIRAAGLAVVCNEELGAELIESADDGLGSRDLMRLARMRRRRDALIPLWGLARYETVSAFYHWIVYQLLGKLTSAFYVLQKPADARDECEEPDPVEADRRGGDS